MSRKLPPLSNDNSDLHWSRKHGEMNGGEIFFAFEKKLTMSDVNQSVSHVILNKEEMITFVNRKMNEEERVRTDSLRSGLPVVAIDLTGRPYGVVIKWLSSINEYVLMGNWNDIVQNYGLEEGDSICVYFFRHGDDDERGDKDLCLIIEAVEMDGD